MELKTINQIIDECEEKGDKKESFNVRNYLRQEAVKDIKAVQTVGKTPEDKLWEEITKKQIVYSEEAKQGIINYIKWKFNLLKVDLK